MKQLCKKYDVFVLTFKYWWQGDTLHDALVTARFIVNGFKTNKGK